MKQIELSEPTKLCLGFIAFLFFFFQVVSVFVPFVGAVSPREYCYKLNERKLARIEVPFHWAHRLGCWLAEEY